jgi:hypothetical protein
MGGPLFLTYPSSTGGLRPTSYVPEHPKPTSGCCDHYGCSPDGDLDDDYYGPYDHRGLDFDGRSDNRRRSNNSSDDDCCAYHQPNNGVIHPIACHTDEW